MTRTEILAAIALERSRQGRRWGGGHAWGEGDCSSALVAPIVKAAVLSEECGEVVRAVLDREPDTGLRYELVQVAAVCFAWLESL